MTIINDNHSNSIATESIENLVKKPGGLIWHAQGFSMLPLIREHKDLVIVKRLGRAPEVLDIVLFRSASGKYILHRVIKMNDGKCVTLGDNSIIPEYINEDEILGTMTGLVRDGKEYDLNNLPYKLYLMFWIRPWWLRIKTKRLVNAIKRII